jgi:hypothetical protein
MLANGIRMFLLIPSSQVLSSDFFNVILPNICNIHNKGLKQGGEENYNSLNLIFLSQSQDNVR